MCSMTCFLDTFCSHFIKCDDSEDIKNSTGIEMEEL